MKTYILTGDAACFGINPIYVSCPEQLIEKYVAACKYGCSECRSYQEIDDMNVDEIDVFVTVKGTVFSKEITIL